MARDTRLALALVLVLAAAPPARAVRAVDPALLDFSRDGALFDRVPPPFLATFTDGSTTLTYVVAEHASGEGSATLKTVRAGFEAPEELVIVEGMSLGTPDERRSSLEYVARCAAESFAHCSEPQYAVQLASERGVAYESAEPRDEDVLRSVRAAGYSTEDLLGFYMLRSIPTMKVQGRLPADLDEAGLAGRLLREQAPIRERLGAGDFTVERFKSWYRVRGPGKSLLAIDSRDTAPDATGATYVGRISEEVDRARETSILRRVQDAVNGHRRVLVVFGAWHFAAEKPVLEKLLGPARLSKPF